MKYQYDVIVIGSGPGGEGAAIKSKKAGLNVAMVDLHPQVGGNCTHYGTIPSKALRHAVQQQLRMPGPIPTYGELLKNAEGVIAKQVKLRQGFYDRNGIDIIHGEASFLDANTLKIQIAEGIVEKLTAKHFVIATGSRPYRPAGIDFSHPRILDSDKVLTYAQPLRSITIYGAGVIGCEYASIFRGLGIKVNLINTRGELLSNLDAEIVDALCYHFRQQGILIRHNEKYTKVVPQDDKVTVHLESNKAIHTDVLLYAQGRSGNTEYLNLDKIGIKVDSRGCIQVNDDYQTSAKHIYAVGDVVGAPSLASAAYDQGRFAATHLVEGKCPYHLVKDIPTGIYTIPEISSVGATERELTEQKIPYEVGHALFKNIARAHITGERVGMLKLLFHRESLEILGIHCFGANASEIIHIGQAIFSQKGQANSLMYFINTTFNYPTMAEAYRVAALNGLNRLD